MTDQMQEFLELQKAFRELIIENHQEKHDMEQAALRTAFTAYQQREEAHRQAHTDAHDAHEKIHQVALEAHLQQHGSENRAVGASASAMDKRLDAMNHIREELQEFARIDRVEEIAKNAERRYEELRNLIATEREERRSNEGVRRGMSQTTAAIIAAIGVATGVIGAVVVVVNVITSRGM